MHLRVFTSSLVMSKCIGIFTGTDVRRGKSISKMHMIRFSVFISLPYNVHYSIAQVSFEEGKKEFHFMCLSKINV